MSELIKLTEFNSELYASSLEIAKNFNKEHKNVLSAIRELENSKKFGLLDFKPSYYLNLQNKQQPFYLLSRKVFSIIVMGFTGELALDWKIKYDDAFEKMANSKSLIVPRNFKEAVQALLVQIEINEDKDKQLAIAAPKVNFYDTVTVSQTVCQMAVAAQVAKLPFGRNTLFKKLREDGYFIDSKDRYNLPKQDLITRGLFTVDESSYENPVNGSRIVVFTPHVTQKGIDWLVKKYK